MTQEPLLHRKQRFLFYRSPGEPAAFLLDPLRTAERGGARFRGFDSSRAYPVAASAALPGRAFLAPEPLCCSSGSADKRSAGLPAEGDGGCGFSSASPEAEVFVLPLAGRTGGLLKPQLHPADLSQQRPIIPAGIQDPADLHGVSNDRIEYQVIFDDPIPVALGCQRQVLRSRTAFRHFG